MNAYHANAIAENIYAQVDDDGYQILLLQDIIDHKKGRDAIAIDNGTFFRNGRTYQERTARG